MKTYLAAVSLVLGLIWPSMASINYLDLGDTIIKVKTKAPINAPRFSLDHDQVFSFAFSPDSRSIAYFSIDPETMKVSLKLTTIKPIAITNLAEWPVAEGIPEKEITWSPQGHAFCFKIQFTQTATLQTMLAAVPWKAIIPIDPEGRWEELTWSPDGRLIVFKVNRELTENPQNAEPADELGFYDLATKSARPLFSVRSFRKFLGWSDSRTLILLESRDDKGNNTQLILVNLDKPQDAILSPVPNWRPRRLFSYDLKWICDNTKTGVQVNSTNPAKLDQKISLTKDPKASFVAWSPKDLCLTYSPELEIKNDSGKSQRKYKDLWLVGLPQEVKETIKSLNQQILVAQNIDSDNDIEPPVWSPDGLKIAYISEGLLWVALLERVSGEEAIKQKEAYEKELKIQAITQAKIIGIALKTYSDDYDQTFPSNEDIVTKLEPYIKDTSLFYHPDDPNMMVFYYTPPDNLKENEVQFPAETILGYIDYGLGWKAVIYADGHAKIQ
jgi:hypothetical protein